MQVLILEKQYRCACAVWQHLRYVRTHVDGVSLKLDPHTAYCTNSCNRRIHTHTSNYYCRLLLPITTSKSIWGMVHTVYCYLSSTDDSKLTHNNLLYSMLQSTHACTPAHLIIISY
jgi:hypothetical protein